ncbi:hypothetical protein [Qipengyuania pacifica]|uniref:hypothetical protein n=1 Tax=Qipengyuania pacifica TaxID=2860199 RepID=UPI001C9DE1FD|nr:hypothetical protein [Qipengyuania pacifica]MBY8333142.1 hypothetical protein [Qipengyuania pacifica]
MNAQVKVEPPTLDKLREPFPQHHISKLPKPTKAQNDAVKADFKKGIRCKICGGWHHPDVVHLDYVGHAALTDRLLDTDPHWYWEPVSFGQDGLPAFDQNGGLWIKLTVLDVTRLGYGSADGKKGGDAIKEIIGDALRNAAMRFGAALDLWHKGDLHADEPTAEEAKEPKAEMPDAEWARLAGLIKATGTDTADMCKHYGVENLRHLDQDQYGKALEALNTKLARMAKAESDQKAKQSEKPASDFAEVLEDEIPY